MNVEGLYRADKRDGPGLYSVDDSDVSTAQDDVGFWSRDHLVKLCVAVPGVFTVAEHWPLSISHPDSQHLAETAVSDHGCNRRCFFAKSYLCHVFKRF